MEWGMTRSRRTGSGSGCATRPAGESGGAWRRAVAWAARIAADPLVVYLDTETTGLGAEDEIVDLAVVGSGGEVLLDTLVRPSRPIPPAASAIHRLTDADVAEAPAWHQVYPALRDLVCDRVVVVYNADFDRRLITQCCIRCGVDPPVADWHCAMRAYADFHGEPGRAGGFRWHPLERAVRTVGALPGTSWAAHRALADALACRAVVLGMAGMVEARE